MDYLFWKLHWIDYIKPRYILQTHTLRSKPSTQAIRIFEVSHIPYTDIIRGRSKPTKSFWRATWVGGLQTNLQRSTAL